MHYDIQKLRIAAGNRLVANFYSDLEEGKKNVESKTKAKENTDDGGGKKKDFENEKKIKSILQEYSSITDGLVANNRTIKAQLKEMSNELAIIKSDDDYKMVTAYRDLRVMEHEQALVVEHRIKDIPIYAEYLKNIRGCGPLMAAVIISELDPYKARTPSAFWKYAGLDVVTYEKDGEMISEGRGKKSEHLVDKTYTNQKGEVIQTKGISYNPFLKSKLVGVLAGSFLMSKSDYGKIYYDYKHRITTDPARAGRKDIVYHNQSTRFMIKVFLADLWRKWREMEGLETVPWYSEKFMNIRPHGSDPSVEVRRAI
jgi:hypothetical protein